MKMSTTIRNFFCGLIGWMTIPDTLSTPPHVEAPSTRGTGLVPDREAESREAGQNSATPVDSFSDTPLRRCRSEDFFDYRSAVYKIKFD